MEVSEDERSWQVGLKIHRSSVKFSRVEAIITEITERREFLYPSINGQPMKRSKMRRNVVRFRNSQDKASSVVLNFL